MAILPELYLHCDRCGLCFGEGSRIGINMSRTHLRAKAKRDGWTRQHWGKKMIDLCPNCTEGQSDA